jgi:ribosomal protein L40E
VDINSNKRKVDLFCPQCGSQNADDATFCVRCGRDLRPGAPAITPSAVIPPGGVPPVSNYLVPAILVTVLCCLPTGIAAIVFAAQVNTKLAAGDVAGAQESSRKAKMWCWISAAAGIAVMIGYTIITILAVSMRRH